jgi:hypothetical protein
LSSLQGYAQLFDDKEKVTALLEQAAEFAMTGEELIELADGYLRLLNDEDAAVGAYEKALAEITSMPELLALAKKAATELENKELAKQAYGKAESKMTSAKDLVALAQAVLEDLEDQSYASAVYARAEEKLSAPNELITLADEIVRNLKDQERAAALYQRALEKTSGFAALVKLADTVAGSVDAVSLERAILEKAAGVAQSTPEFIELADRMSARLGNKKLEEQMLNAAEERVTNLDEMRKVTEAVKAKRADDSQWIARVEEKLAKREANQAKYATFQKLEKELQTFKQGLSLVDRVMAELEDPFYTRKLLNAAEERLASKFFDFNNYRLLIMAINRHLQDQVWLERLLDHCAAQSDRFVTLRQVCSIAVQELGSAGLGAQLARKYYKVWEQSLGDAGETAKGYEFTKLAEGVQADLGDDQWYERLLDEAEQRAHDHFAYAHLGHLVATMGDGSRAVRLYEQAARACSTGTDCVQLANRLRQYGLERDALRRIYAMGKENLQEEQERLRWAEGIFDVLQDSQWASEAYAELAKSMTSEQQRRAFLASRASRLERRFY